MALETPELYKRSMFSKETDLNLVAKYHPYLEIVESWVLPAQLTRKFVDTKKIKVPMLVIGKETYISQVICKGIAC